MLSDANQSSQDLRATLKSTTVIVILARTVARACRMARLSSVLAVRVTLVNCAKQISTSVRLTLVSILQDARTPMVAMSVNARQVTAERTARPKSTTVRGPLVCTIPRVSISRRLSSVFVILVDVEIDVNSQALGLVWCLS